MQDASFPTFPNFGTASGWQPETFAYMALPGVSMTPAQIAALDGVYRSLKAGGSITLSSVVMGVSQVDVGAWPLNGAFSSTPDNWTGGDATLASISGGQSGNCLQITQLGAGPGNASQALSILSGTRIYITGYVKSGTSGNEAYRVTLVTAGGNVDIVTGISSGEWVKWSWSGTLASDLNSIYLIKDTTTAGSMLYDEVTIEKPGAFLTNPTYTFLLVPSSDLRWIPDGYKIVTSDGGVAYKRGNGTGETLGTNPFATFDFTSGWTTSNATVSDVDTFVSSVAGGILKSGISNIGELRKVVVSGNSTSTVFVRSSNGLQIFLSTLGTGYGTVVNTGFYLRNQGAGTTDITVLQFPKVLTPSNKGITLTSTALGATYNWAAKGTTPNSPVDVIITRQ